MPKPLNHMKYDMTLRQVVREFWRRAHEYKKGGYKYSDHYLRSELVLVLQGITDHRIGDTFIDLAQKIQNGMKENRM